MRSSRVALCHCTQETTVAMQAHDTNTVLLDRSQHDTSLVSVGTCAFACPFAHTVRVRTCSRRVMMEERDTSVSFPRIFRQTLEGSTLIRPLHEVP